MISASMIRWSGLAAMCGGLLGIVSFPFHALAWFATPDGAEALDTYWVAAWTGAVRPILEPLLTFASPDVVYLTYGKLTSLAVLGFLAGTIGLHARHARRGGRLERWGFRVAITGTGLLTLGAFGSYWLGYVDLAYLAFAVPGFLLTMVGSTLFGLGARRAQVAPRLGAWLLILGGLPGIIVMATLVGHLSGGLALLDLAWIVLGHALWVDKSVEMVRQVPAVT